MSQLRPSVPHSLGEGVSILAHHLLCIVRVKPLLGWMEAQSAWTPLDCLEVVVVLDVILCQV